jgi:hypothetical protein
MFGNTKRQMFQENSGYFNQTSQNFNSFNRTGSQSLRADENFAQRNSRSEHNDSAMIIDNPHSQTFQNKTFFVNQTSQNSNSFVASSSNFGMNINNFNGSLFAHCNPINNSSGSANFTQYPNFPTVNNNTQNWNQPPFSTNLNPDHTNNRIGIINNIPFSTNTNLNNNNNINHYNLLNPSNSRTISDEIIDSETMQQFRNERFEFGKIPEIEPPLDTR